MLALRFSVVSALVLAGAPSFAQAPPRPNETPRAVTLPLAEYNRLIDLAARPPQGPTTPPVGAVLANADLRIRVDRDTARGVFTMTGDALRPGISRVGLLSGATVTEANAAGRPLPLVADGTAHTALVPGPGPFSLTLEWGAPLVYRPGRATFVLPVPQAGTARATIDVPGEQADVHLSAGLITRRAIAGGRTVIEATLDPGSSTDVSWSMRDSAPVAAAREVRTVADVLTLLTLGDSDLRMAALIDLTVIQGQVRTVAVQLPPRYELTGVSGSTVETSERRDDELVVTLTEPSARSHQLLITLERPHEGGSFAVDTGFITVRDVQRERGEIAIDGVGTLELEAPERNGMLRIDVRELNPSLRALSRLPMLSAFRYQRTAAMVPALSLDVKRFADVGVLAAVADRAVATTLVTSEGRALTEVALQIQNRAQPFLKVTLPAGATMVSVDVAGETAKPVLGADGIRVPLLRPGFRPSGTYQVSFVYVHAGTPFARKGEMQMMLPRMDIPVAIVRWEVFVPERYKARTVDGNAIDLASVADVPGAAATVAGFNAPVALVASPSLAETVQTAATVPGQIRGLARDASGAVLPGVTVTLTRNGSTRTAVTDRAGMFVFDNVQPGDVTVDSRLAGFDNARMTFVYHGQPLQLELPMRVGGQGETITVTAASPVVDVQSTARAATLSNESAGVGRLDRTPQTVPPSQNVINLQRRTSGVLPIRVDVPRAGTSHQFVKLLVVDEETAVTLRYKRR
jgi:carboxypeptidase family protein